MKLSGIKLNVVIKIFQIIGFIFEPILHSIIKDNIGKTLASES